VAILWLDRRQCAATSNARSTLVVKFAQDIIASEVTLLARQIDAETIPSLLARIRDRDDQAAWETFVEVYSPLVYGFCRLRNLQASDAADVTQEVLLRVSRAIGSFEYDRRKGLFRDWLAQLVTNEIRRHASRRKISPVDLDQADEEAKGETWNEHFQQHVFETALKRCQPHFNKETWCLFERSWLHKLPPETVAAERGVGIERVYVARSRVLKRLRREVAILAEDLP
jgi:RNA polymerase sigma factor (sigma-70 family)